MQFHIKEGGGPSSQTAGRSDIGQPGRGSGRIPEYQEIDTLPFERDASGQGVYDTKTNKLYIFGGNLEHDDIKGLLAREGKANWEDLVKVFGGQDMMVVDGHLTKTKILSVMQLLHRSHPFDRYVVSFNEGQWEADSLPELDHRINQMLMRRGLREGGRGSGNFGHIDIPGVRGGSVATNGGGSQLGKPYPLRADAYGTALVNGILQTIPPGNADNLMRRLQQILASPSPVNSLQLIAELSRAKGILDHIPGGLNPKSPVNTLKLTLGYAIGNLAKNGRIGPINTPTNYNKDPFKRRAQRMGVKW